MFVDKLMKGRMISFYEIITNQFPTVGLTIKIDLIERKLLSVEYVLIVLLKC
jgi:hypothetical protein